LDVQRWGVTTGVRRGQGDPCCHYRSHPTSVR
jgi:hypothetical protein